MADEKPDLSSPILRRMEALRSRFPGATMTELRDMAAEESHAETMAPPRQQPAPVSRPAAPSPPRPSPRAAAAPAPAPAAAESAELAEARRLYATMIELTGSTDIPTQIAKIREWERTARGITPAATAHARRLLGR